MTTKTKNKPVSHRLMVGNNVISLKAATKRKPAQITLALTSYFGGKEEIETFIDRLFKQMLGQTDINIRGLSLAWSDHTDVEETK